MRFFPHYLWHMGSLYIHYVHIFFDNVTVVITEFSHAFATICSYITFFTINRLLNVNKRIRKNGKTWAWYNLALSHQVKKSQMGFGRDHENSTCYDTLSWVLCMFAGAQKDKNCPYAVSRIPLLLGGTMATFVL